MTRGAVLPTPERKRAAVTAMFDEVAPRYDRVNRVISMGLDRRWRRRAVDSLGLPRGALVLDLACGTGDLCDDLAGRGHHPVGVDLSAGMLAARRTAAPVVRGDVLALPMPDASVDGITCGFALRNVTDLAAFFAECARVLRAGGRLAALDAGEPDGAISRLGHHVWFRRVVPFVGARLSGAPDAYRYLPASTAYLPAPGELVAIVERSGLREVRRTTMLRGAVQLLTGTRA